MGFFNVRVSGLESIDADFQKELQTIDNLIPFALQAVASEMKNSLQTHLMNDWYLAWGSPQVYERRTDFGGEGLMSPNYVDVSVTGKTLSFEYKPSGSHWVSKWHTVDGDDLINIIQKNSGWKYPVSLDTQDRMIMPRPFWNNFVDEMANSGIMDAFRKGMSPYVIIPSGNDVELDGDEKL